ncbi:hypothetical protein PAAG_12256 [Paracoccidioides lutzii Pb01]|uniref:Uncharacterized protein n=1 Tax=Paracoccidioides lutzii (strain ATCC MYA-826 / Pb01) TaxID=502779 RepID=A0A0A2V3W2_PARBA|nr:hypothetical protein PAAG_12256 [Paracoccidioides lutzii Pb01]KGQ01062.1 hypothetical protein PAAG_12256 [Paracoccidioides lutzii Pb01]
MYPFCGDHPLPDSYVFRMCYRSLPAVQHWQLINDLVAKEAHDDHGGYPGPPVHGQRFRCKIRSGNEGSTTFRDLGLLRIAAPIYTLECTAICNCGNKP